MGAHILVFNDTQEILDLFQEILTDEGHQVTLATYSTNDLVRVRAVKPDLIIADYPPPSREDQGWQLIQKLKMASDLASIPIIVCTTNLQAIENTQGWLASKGIVTVPKPFTMDELLQAVQTQLSPKSGVSTA